MRAYYYTSGGASVFEASGPTSEMEESISKLQQLAIPKTGPDIRLGLPRYTTTPAATYIYDKATRIGWQCYLTVVPTAWNTGTNQVTCALIASTADGAFTPVHTEANFIAAWKEASKKIADALQYAAAQVGGNVMFSISHGGVAPAFHHPYPGIA